MAEQYLAGRRIASIVLGALVGARIHLHAQSDDATKLILGT